MKGGVTAQVRPSPRWGWAEGFPPAAGGTPLKSGQAGLTGERSAGRHHRARRHEAETDSSKRGAEGHRAGPWAPVWGTVFSAPFGVAGCSVSRRENHRDDRLCLHLWGSEFSQPNALELSLTSVFHSFFLRDSVFYKNVLESSEPLAPAVGHESRGANAQSQLAAFGT